MNQARYRIEVYPVMDDARGRTVARHLQHVASSLKDVRVCDNYLVDVETDPQSIDRLARGLCQPVTQNFLVNQPWIPEAFDAAIEIGFLPGVTDNVAHTVRDMLQDCLALDAGQEAVFSSVTYFLTGADVVSKLEEIALELHNPLIERSVCLTREQYCAAGGMGKNMPKVHIAERPSADQVSLDLSDDELVVLGREGIADADGTRRGPLALDLDSMKVIQRYFAEVEKRQPTDVELESIAQTWSEHCKHTIFAAKIDDDPKGIFKSYIRAATERIRQELGNDDFCESVFTDNAGGITFDENYIVSDKVETHNSPSALDPFGGSITGIVGVNRDEMGFGLGAKPIANRYGFCLADPEDTRPLYRAQDPSTRLLPPRRIMDGVVHGVNVGGNCSGIPTPQGFVYFHERYKAKPMVFVGTVGLLPRSSAGRPATRKKALPGDLVIVAGGRVGRDGIHGATFSSEALSAGSPATAVQIGDPITQKKMSDVIVKEARDLDLYNSITDNGAGGLSCSVAEMAKESGGFVADLDKVPLKYPGLSPWQIWVSESQERMTFSVPPQKAQRFIALLKSRGVEATVIGEFTSSGRAVVRYHGETVLDLDMDFLHDGLPQKCFVTEYHHGGEPVPSRTVPADFSADLLAMLGRLNLCSYEWISMQYDHEVQGNSVLKPLQGPGRVQSSASVIRPLPDSRRGVVLSQGLYPTWSEIDAYAMAAASIDTAVRAAVAVGGSIDRMAILDNYCWCDSTNSRRLGQLKASAQACYDYAVAYRTPYVSGKDSMFNDFKGYDENFKPCAISVPPTLLVSAIGVIDDIDFCQSLDFKMSGDLVYVIGQLSPEIGGSEYLALKGEQTQGQPWSGTSLPAVDASLNIEVYRAFERALRTGLVASSISVERGGLATALARSAMAGQIGANIDFGECAAGDPDNEALLFAESQGVLLASVAPESAQAFERVLDCVPFRRIGTVQGDRLVVRRGSANLLDASVTDMSAAYQARMKNY